MQDCLETQGTVSEKCVQNKLDTLLGTSSCKTLLSMETTQQQHLVLFRSVTLYSSVESMGWKEEWGAEGVWNNGFNEWHNAMLKENKYLRKP